jgi:hypothetical protein
MFVEIPKNAKAMDAAAPADAAQNPFHLSKLVRLFARYKAAQPDE